MTLTELLQTWVPLTVGILTIGTIIGGFVYRLNKKFHAFVEAEIKDVVKEFKPNGGSSLKDQVNRLESGHDKINKDVEDLRDEILEIKDNNNRLDQKLDKMFDTLLKIVDKFNK